MSTSCRLGNVPLVICLVLNNANVKGLLKGGLQSQIASDDGDDWLFVPPSAGCWFVRPMSGPQWCGTWKYLSSSPSPQRCHRATGGCVSVFSCEIFVLLVFTMMLLPWQVSWQCKNHWASPHLWYLIISIHHCYTIVMALNCVVRLNVYTIHINR